MTKLTDPPPGFVVVKVGGSLYDHPRLGPGLRTFLDGLDSPCVLVVAGGGVVVDAVRDLAAWQSLDEETAHELAMTGTYLSMHFVRDLIEVDRLTASLAWWTTEPDARVMQLHCTVFLTRYENAFGPVPHTWDLTTDSIAAFAAAVGRAKLILLKSIDVPPGTSWEEAAARGWVDAHFPKVVAEYGIDVEVVNFRRRLDRAGY